MNEQLRRIRFVTQYYEWLQGLRFLPLGLLMVGMAGWMAVGDIPLGTKPLGGAPWVMGVGLALWGAFYPVLGIYYRRRFGDVRPSAATRQTRRRMILAFTGAGFLVGVGAALLEQAGNGRPVPVSLVLVLTAVGLAAYWAATGRIARHYLSLAAALVALAALHALGVQPVCALMRALPYTHQQRCEVITVYALLGLAMAASSVLDHRLLARTLRPVQPEDSAAEEPGREGAAG